MEDITAIILTKNEELNIAQCIESIRVLVKRIVVIDSYSTDCTVEIAKKLGAEIYQNEFEYHAKQYNKAIELSKPTTKWILRIDADERLTEDSRNEIEQLCKDNADSDVNGIVLRFEVEFMGRKLRHGGIYPFRKLLVYRNGFGEMEDRLMDEHITVATGRVIYARCDSEHHDYKDLSRFIEKHNKYATAEARQYLQRKDSVRVEGLAKGARIKRYIKYGIYYKLPAGFRAKLYYFYRYYLLLGFLDGREGKIYAFLQAYWYRYLVDAKIYEQQKRDSFELN